MTACVLVRRGEEWLLSVRGPEVAYAPGRIGLIGGHLELADADLEAAARRELAEETGIDLGATRLQYLESALIDADGEVQLTVTFVAESQTDAEPVVRAADELSEVGWWRLADLAADPRCPTWLPGLIRRAGIAGAQPYEARSATTGKGISAL